MISLYVAMSRESQATRSSHRQDLLQGKELLAAKPLHRDTPMPE